MLSKRRGKIGRTGSQKLELGILGRRRGREGGSREGPEVPGARERDAEKRTLCEEK